LLMLINSFPILNVPARQQGRMICVRSMNVDASALRQKQYSAKRIRVQEESHVLCHSRHVVFVG
jgi:hypothetical protein